MSALGVNLTASKRSSLTLSVSGERNFETEYESLQLEQELGRGAFGVVYRGKCADLQSMFTVDMPNRALPRCSY